MEEEIRTYNLIANNRTYEVTVTIEKAFGSLFFVVGEGVPTGGRGCVWLSCGTDADEHAVALQWFGYTSDRPDMQRGKGSKTMLIGALIAFKEFARLHLPHVRLLQLTDSATFKCTNTANIDVMIVSLILHKKSYYQKMLDGLVLSNMETRKLLVSTLNRISAKIDKDFEWFWTVVTSKSQFTQKHRNADLEWLNANKNGINDLFVGCRRWDAFLKKVHRRYNCKFFECCFHQLADMFKIRRLCGKEWEMPLSDVPEAVDGVPLSVKLVQTGRGAAKRGKRRVNAGIKLLESMKTYTK